MKITKRFTPRPNGEEGNSLGKTCLTDFILEASAENLNEMDQSTLIKLFVTLIKNNEEKLDLIIDGLIKTRVYSFMHREYQQIKIGFTNDWETRKKFTKKLVGFFLAQELAHNKDTRKKLNAS